MKLISTVLTVIKTDIIKLMFFFQIHVVNNELFHKMSMKYIDYIVYEYLKVVFFIKIENSKSLLQKQNYNYKFFNIISYVHNVLF